MAREKDWCTKIASSSWLPFISLTLLRKLSFNRELKHFTIKPFSITMAAECWRFLKSLPSFAQSLEIMPTEKNPPASSRIWQQRKTVTMVLNVSKYFRLCTYYNCLWHVMRQSSLWISLPIMWRESWSGLCGVSNKMWRPLSQWGQARLGCFCTVAATAQHSVGVTQGAL